MPSVDQGKTYLAGTWMGLAELPAAGTKIHPRQHPKHSTTDAGLLLERSAGMKRDDDQVHVGCDRQAESCAQCVASRCPGGKTGRTVPASRRTKRSCRAER